MCGVNTRHLPYYSRVTESIEMCEWGMKSADDCKWDLRVSAVSSMWKNTMKPFIFVGMNDLNFIIPTIFFQEKGSYSNTPPMKLCNREIKKKSTVSRK